MIVAAPSVLVWEGVVRLREPLRVPEGGRLEIRAGTRVVIERSPGARTGIEVLGSLEARGEPGAQVIFFPEGEWAGLRFLGAARGDLQFARVEGVRGELAAAMGSARLSLLECRLQDGGNGLRLSGSSAASLERCQISGMAGVGVLLEDEARARLGLTALRQNATGVAATGRSQVVLDGCSIEGSPQCGVNALGASRAAVYAGELARNHTAVSSAEEASLDVRDAVVRDNLVGVHAGGRSRANLVGNRFSANRALDVDLVDAALARSLPALPRLAAGEPGLA